MLGELLPNGEGNDCGRGKASLGKDKIERKPKQIE